jgi:hypothetical protein
MKAGVLLSWTAHPARTRPRDVALLVAVTATTAGCVLYSLESLFLCALAVVVLLVAVAPFWLPTHYSLTDDGISAVRMGLRRVRRFRDLRRVDVDRDPARASTVLVSPFARPTWLCRTRGMTLFLDGADRAGVVAFLKERIEREAH